MYYLRHIDPLCMFRGYVVLIENLSHRSTVYSGGCAMIDMTTWIHSVCLVAMTFVYDVISL
jgi:hypothetical protein